MDAATESETGGEELMETMVDGATRSGFDARADYELEVESGRLGNGQGDLGFRHPEEDRSEEQQPDQTQELANGVEDLRELGSNPSEEDQIKEQDRENATQLLLPPGRVKRIMKLDREINKVHSEALFLVSLSTELFLEFLAEKAGAIALANKKKSVRLDHLLSAARNHPPSADFLLDSLSLPAKPLPETKPIPSVAKPLPPGSRRIDEFFSRPS